MRIRAFIYSSILRGRSLCIALLYLTGSLYAEGPADGELGPAISSISIPDVPMGLGDVVPVTIRFEPYAGTGEFIYVGGTIESEALDEGSLQRIDDTTCVATFTVGEDTPNRLPLQSIRVRDFQFSEGGEPGPVFSADIMQSNDPIDTKPPRVYYIRFQDPGPHIVGSAVNAFVRADGTDYRFDLSRSWINGVSFSFSQVEVENNLDSTYRVTYTPREGERDVPQGEAIEVEIVMTDGTGNRNQPPCTTVFNDLSPVIDANSASLDSAVVRNPGVKVTGDEILIDLYASESLRVPDPPLEGSHVNFVPVSSPRVSFRHISGLVYELSYTVGAGDNGVRAGEMSFNLEMQDLAGNRSHSNIPLENNDISIGTGSPTATITGGGSICAGDSLAVYLYMTGESPWEVVVQNRQGIYDSVFADHSPYTLWIKSEEANTFTVSSVRDGRGTAGNTFGSAVLGVYQNTPVEILLDQGTYLSSDPGVELRASLEPGVFAGKGVSGGYFYPSVAGTEKSPHSISYHYRNDFGCSTYDTVLINVVEGSGSVVLLSGGDTVSILCDDSGSYRIQAENENGFPGSFRLVVTNTGTEVPGHISDEDPGDNRALFSPGGLKGGYDILYDFEIDGVPLTASTYVKLEQVEAITIVEGPEGLVCKNEAPFELRGNLDNADPLAQWSFSGRGVSGDMYSGFQFDPSGTDVEPGLQEITYEYISEGGCRAGTGHEFTVGYVPELDFGISTACIDSEGGEIAFDNTSSGKNSVETWSWDFGDYASGSDNYSNQENPVHFYSGPGLKSINLTASTTEGCITYVKLDTLLSDNPDVDFTWASDCHTTDSEVVFINTSDAAYSSLDTLIWNFRNGGGGMPGIVGASPGEDSIRIPLTLTGSYSVELYVRNVGGCDASLEKTFNYQPTRVISGNGLHERFDDSDGDWMPASSSEPGNWVWGTPDFRGYSGDSSDRAWYTDLPVSEAGFEEHSWIVSPCYDFSALDRPMIRVDIMKSFLPGISGAVLQYQDKVDEGWKTIGLLDEGMGWYNSPSILFRPGGSAYGWGTDDHDPDTAWISAVHDLDFLAGRKNIKLRFAIGTHGEKDGLNQGLAVNDLHLMNRSRKAVLEHFTNADDAASRVADDRVDAFYASHKMDVIDLQYHLNYPGPDPMNENNPAPASTRAGILGVGQVPFAVMNGVRSSLYRYDFSSPDHYPAEEYLMKAVMGEEISFHMGMGILWGKNSMEVTVQVQCATDYYARMLQLYVVVIESELSAYTGGNGDTSFRNVVLDMLPSPAGKLLGGDWWKGKVEERTYGWDYADYVEDLSDLGVVAFIQDRETGEILQATTGHMESGVGFREEVREDPVMRVWPNPAGSDWIRVSIGEEAGIRGRLVLLDLSGRILKEWQVDQGKSEYTLDIQDLESGYYQLLWLEGRRIRGRASLVCSGRFH